MRVFISVAASVVAATMAVSAQDDTADKAPARAPVLAELFTSQSCSSCPPAEKFFNELADDEDVVAIQWHVDYWDNLVHAGSGSWDDPFSKAYHTARQRDYNYAIRGTNSVYTPQAVIGGMAETTGSRRRSVARLLATAPPAEVAITFEPDGTGYIIHIDNAEGNDRDMPDAEIMLVELVKHHKNDIEGGENRGRFAEGRNIAIRSDTLGAWTGGSESYRTEIMQENHTCAVIVQERSRGRVLGAAYCPS